MIYESKNDGADDLRILYSKLKLQALALLTFLRQETVRGSNTHIRLLLDCDIAVF